MTLSPEERQAVVQIRMRNAETALDDARVLLSRGSLRGAANRLYYAAFHAVSALAMTKGMTARTHRGVIGFFHSQCIETGLLKPQFGYALQKAFEERSEADYEDDVSLDASILETRISEVDELVGAIRPLLEASKGS